MNDTVGIAACDRRKSAASFSRVASANEARPDEGGGRLSPGNLLQGGSVDRPAPPGFRRIGAVSGLRLLLQDHGQDCRAFFAEAGFLLAHCAGVTRYPHLGISLGARASLDSLGIVGSVMRRCDTL